MALPALEVRADCEQRTENGQLNRITAAAGDAGCSNHSSPWWWHFPFFWLFFHRKINSMGTSSCWWGTKKEGNNPSKLINIKAVMKGGKIQFCVAGNCVKDHPNPSWSIVRGLISGIMMSRCNSSRCQPGKLEKGDV